MRPTPQNDGAFQVNTLCGPGLGVSRGEGTGTTGETDEASLRFRAHKGILNFLTLARVSVRAVT
jgi:hypothetical protein